MLVKNAIQKIHVYAYDSTTGAAKTGDAANITAYVSLDGAANAIDDTNPTEVDSTNMPGIYVFDLTAAETNCDSFALYAKSSTSNIRIEPIIGFTTTGTAAAIAATVPDTQKVDVNTIKTQTVTCAAAVTVNAQVGADNKLDVNANGEAGIDWGNVGNKTATVTLSNTTINDVTTKTGYTASPTAGSIVTASFGTCVAPAGFIAAASIATGAITSAKFDGTTAFPLTSADSGATAVFRTGADGDTGETLSDQIDAVGVAISAVPASVEAAILDEGDATALLAAIAAKVEEFLINEGDATATLAAIATAVNAAVVAGQVGTQVGTINSRVLGTIAAGTHNPQSGDAYAYLGTNLGLLGANATALASAADLAAANVVLAKVDTTLVQDGAVYDFTAAALAAAPSSSGGDATEAKQDTIIALLGTPADTDVSTDLANLQASVDALDVGGGSGAYACTWTVNDGSTALQGAAVSFWLNGVLKGTGTTDANGEVSMSLNAAKYTVAIVLTGYTFANTTHTVSSTSTTWTHTFSMTAVTITAPTNAGTATGRLDLHTKHTTAETYQSIYVRQTARRSGTGHGDSKEWRELVSDASGVIEAAFWKSQTYEAKRGLDGTPVAFTVGTDDTFYLPSILGEP